MVLYHLTFFSNYSVVSIIFEVALLRSLIPKFN